MSQSAINLDFSNLERINHKKLQRLRRNLDNALTYPNFSHVGIYFGQLLLYTQRFLLEKHNKRKFWDNAGRGREPFP